MALGPYVISVYELPRITRVVVSKEGRIGLLCSTTGKECPQARIEETGGKIKAVLREGCEGCYLCKEAWR